MKTFLKGLFMTAITFLITSLYTTGLPKTAVEWEIMGLTLLGTMLGYFGQSAILPTSSDRGSWDWRDLLKGGIISVANFLTSLCAAGITGSHVDWKAILSAVGTLLIAYLAKQLAAKPKVI